LRPLKLLALIDCLVQHLIAVLLLYGFTMLYYALVETADAAGNDRRPGTTSASQALCCALAAAATPAVH